LHPQVRCSFAGRDMPGRESGSTVDASASASAVGIRDVVEQQTPWTVSGIHTFAVNPAMNQRKRQR
jgi:hypothetical protein